MYSDAKKLIINLESTLRENTDYEKLLFTTEIYTTKAEYFVENLKEIRCGNRAIVKQMQALSYNIDIIDRISEDTGISAVRIDSLLWNFCSVDYANICGAVPKCNLCKLVKNCNFINKR